MDVIFNNASIHRIKEVDLIAKKLGRVVFTILPYSYEQNQIEHALEILNTKISNRD